MRLSLSGKHIGVAIGLRGYRAARAACCPIGGALEAAALLACTRHSFQAGKSAQIARSPAVQGRRAAMDIGAAGHKEMRLQDRRGRQMHRQKNRAALEECLEAVPHRMRAAEADEVAEDFQAHGAGHAGPARRGGRDIGGRGGRQVHAPWKYVHSDGPQPRARRGLNVVYRLPDGTNGWIATQPSTSSKGRAWHQAGQEG